MVLMATSNLPLRANRMQIASVVNLIVHVERSIVGSAERQQLAAKLAVAGITGAERVAMFIAAWMCIAVIVGIAVWLVVETSGVPADQEFFGVTVSALAFVVCWRAPDIVVNRLASRRKLRIEMGIPDALDMLVICTESGLGLEQAVAQVAREMRFSAPEVAAEFGTTASGLKVMSNRRAALENLASRTGLRSLHRLISTLNQAVCTRLSESLRILAGEMRAVRISRLKEHAGRLSVSLCCR
jgi:tight adherence protein C